MASTQKFPKLVKFLLVLNKYKYLFHKFQVHEIKYALQCSGFIDCDFAKYYFNHKTLEITFTMCMVVN